LRPSAPAFLGVDVGASGDQDARDLDLVGVGCDEQCGAAVAVTRIDCRAFTQCGLHNGGIALPRGGNKLVVGGHRLSHSERHDGEDHKNKTGGAEHRLSQLVAESHS